MKNLILAVLCLFSVSVFSQKVEITGQRDGLPLYKVVKDLYKDSKLVGTLQSNTIPSVEYKVYQKTKPNKKGIRTCFYLAIREESTKTQAIGEPYRKTCLCPN
jgi:hypothetical protein